MEVEVQDFVITQLMKLMVVKLLAIQDGECWQCQLKVSQLPISLLKIRFRAFPVFLRSMVDRLRLISKPPRKIYILVLMDHNGLLPDRLRMNWNLVMASFGTCMIMMKA